ncbi:restriction endonuclease subunit S [Methanocella arvoryzae]|nr:restriction endonuclease subunit S [Methanocella arvoryzae]
MSIGNLVVSVKSGISSYYTNGGDLVVPMVNIKDLQDGNIITRSVDKVKIKDTKLLAKNILSKDDIVVSIKGQNYKAAVAGSEHEGYAISSNLIAFTLNDRILPEIVEAYLNSPYGQRELRARASGSTMPGLNTRTLLEVAVPVPPPDKQASIAGYLRLARERRKLLDREQMILEQLKNTIIGDVME